MTRVSQGLFEDRSPLTNPSLAKGYRKSRSENLEQIAQLLVHVGARVQRLGNLLTQNLAVALAQAVHRHLDRTLRHPQGPSNLAVGCLLGIAEAVLEVGE